MTRWRCPCLSLLNKLYRIKTASFLPPPPRWPYTFYISSKGHLSLFQLQGLDKTWGFSLGRQEAKVPTEQNALKIDQIVPFSVLCFTAHMAACLCFKRGWMVDFCYKTIAVTKIQFTQSEIYTLAIIPIKVPLCHEI